MKNLIIIISLLSLSVVGLAIAYQVKPGQTPLEYTYEMCNSSRQFDTPSEAMCGDLQDFYHVEFICKQLNKLPTNECHVEAKS